MDKQWPTATEDRRICQECWEALTAGEESAELIKQAEPNKQGYPRPVICLDTGERFPSLKAAARAKFVSHSSLSRATRRGRQSRTVGQRWAWEDEVV